MNKQTSFTDNWKQDLVLIAKNTFVWMHQLSEKYGRHILHLNQIPYEELLELRANGINGLWLIGIWERSPASKRIKELYGKQDCIASAYSIYKYQISKNLGGEQAFFELKKNARRAGIKLGCDIVPNHTGIDSPWVVDHPDWFIQSDGNPTSYFQYNSPNLSSDPKVEIRIEEGYFSQTGAAEVFQYQNNQSGKISYIYHGNDGTNMPWNDTAQLNYLNPDTRIAVRELIVEIAKYFDIIRFDAAMTLTKQHYKRLWFPNKGEEKYIPTRGACNMTKEDFNKNMPNEFWIEVLKDIREFAPDALLIAEAFWLMEGFFINELGMDRVYNSAFMNLLRDENNQKFILFIKDVCNWDPYFLEHMVNYQSTPDEEPAINQFGDKEKYLGVCTLLATFPGLPMFGHGQIEGYRERYGMDFLQPRFQENPRDEMIDVHQLIIKPLLDNRHKYSGSKNFKLHDYFQDDERIINDVIVFSNKNDSFSSLVIFNNSKYQYDGYFQNPFREIEGLNTQLIDFFTEEEIEIPKSSETQCPIFIPISAYECRVFDVVSMPK